MLARHSIDMNQNYMTPLQNFMEIHSVVSEAEHAENTERTSQLCLQCLLFVQ
jgi:hypothetical protein